MIDLSIQKQTGYSLLETMMAVGILSLLTVVSMSLYSNQMRDLNHLKVVDGRNLILATLNSVIRQPTAIANSLASSPELQSCISEVPTTIPCVSLTGSGALVEHDFDLQDDNLPSQLVAGPATALVRYTTEGQLCTATTTEPCVYDARAWFIADCDGLPSCIPARRIRVFFEIKPIVGTPIENLVANGMGAFDYTTPFRTGGGDTLTVPLGTSTTSLATSVVTQTASNPTPLSPPLNPLDVKIGGVTPTDFATFGNFRINENLESFAPVQFVNNVDCMAASVGVLRGDTTIRGDANVATAWVGYAFFYPTPIGDLVTRDLITRGPYFSHDAVFAGSINYSSDRRLKKDIQPLADVRDKVQKLNGVHFQWKDSGKPDIGFIAQEVEPLFPELVRTEPNGMKSVKYGNLTAVLLAAFQNDVAEQKKQQSENDHRIIQLQERLSQLHAQVKSGGR